MPDARENPLTMTTVSVGALINLWTETDDPSVYDGYITAATPASGLDEDRLPAAARPRSR